MLTSTADSLANNSTVSISLMLSLKVKLHLQNWSPSARPEWRKHDVPEQIKNRKTNLQLDPGLALWKESIAYF